jgi:hypothetical protein
VSVKLTDKYPNTQAVQQWVAASNEAMEYVGEPVDATNARPHLRGMRTLFGVFHHFRSAWAQEILRNAARQGGYWGLRG